MGVKAGCFHCLAELGVYLPAYFMKNIFQWFWYLVLHGHIAFAVRIMFVVFILLMKCEMASY